MQTNLTQAFLDTSLGRRADEILRKCVHCGFCTATCPTYQLLGDELDGPRGRIYQIKQLLEGQPTDNETLLHLDRCLTCRSCETTCPSGVGYAELIDTGRLLIEKQDIRPAGQKVLRSLLGAVLPHSGRNRLLFKMASLFRPFMPASLRTKAPLIRSAKSYSSFSSDTRKTVLLLDGCVQKTLSPNTNSAATAVLQALGYTVIREPSASCCGAVNHHLSQTEKAEAWVVNNLQSWQKMDAQHPLDAIVSTASGCGAMLQDYPKILQHIPQHKDSFQAILGKIKDISELLDADSIISSRKNFHPNEQKVSWHAPCTLNHGLHLAERLFNQLEQLGYQLTRPVNEHLCCGSAGTYSVLQPTLSRQLRDNKLNALQQFSPELIITANIGCEHHLNSATETDVIHWVELLADDLQKT